MLAEGHNPKNTKRNGSTRCVCPFFATANLAKNLGQSSPNCANLLGHNVPPLMSSLRQKLSDSARFWEGHRELYNLWLLGVALFAVMDATRHYFTPFNGSRGLLGLLVFLLLANAAYSAAYPLDIFVQVFGRREERNQLRWILLLGGMVSWGLVTRVLATSLLYSPTP